MSPRRLSFIAASDHLQPPLAELSEFRAASTGRRTRAVGGAPRTLGIVAEVGPEHDVVPARIAAAGDLDGITATLSAAFASDPLWSWAFPAGRKLDVYWRFLVEAAIPHRWVWVLGDYQAVSVWIPPGERELSEADEQRVAPLMRELLGARADDVLQLFDRFDRSHPHDEQHYYLSLLASHPTERGRGLGMRLLAENLARIDEQSMPAYLESSNPANVGRYERLGFRSAGSFSTPDDSHTVTTMWRRPRPDEG
jgi:GNAT superfamily N-acetyltransferase